MKELNRIKSSNIHKTIYAIYGNIYHQYTPFMLAYIPAPWILWVGSSIEFSIQTLIFHLDPPGTLEKHVVFFSFWPINLILLPILGATTGDSGCIDIYIYI